MTLKQLTHGMLLAALLSWTSLATAQTYKVYPVPQKMTAGQGTVQLTPTVNVVAESGIDQATRTRLGNVLKAAGLDYQFTESASSTQTNIYLGINGSSGSVDVLATSSFSFNAGSMMIAEKFDRHALILNDKGLLIIGEHTNAVFFGIATLEQILEQQTAGTLAAVTIYDWADQQSRGLVEGYYGYPYSVSVKKDLMHFMMRYKMNTYMYGAKSDPYHSQKWTEAYPTSITAEQEKNGWLSQAMVRDIAQTSAETKVNFIWAIHPGNDFVGNSSVVSNIMGKFEKMHALGVRQFAVFVDDVGIPSTQADMKTNADRLTTLQKAIEAKWNTPGTAATDTVRPLHFVPQIYCSSFASSTEQRQNFMKALGETPDYITIYTTGQGVWTVPNSEHTLNMKNELSRPMAWWWNYPCNDNADGQIYTMDMYSNFYDLPSVDGNSRMPQQFTNCLGLVSNPMQEGEVAKVSLFSVADYAWNNQAFDNQQSWNASFQAILSDPKVRQAYQDLAYYLRWNEPSSLRDQIEAYKTSLDSKDLRQTLQTIADNCTLVETLKQSATESDRLLYNDVRPWLQKLHTDVITLLGLLDVREMTDPTERWARYCICLDSIQSLKNSTTYTAYALEGMGSGISVSQRQAQVSQLYLEPFLFNYMQGKAVEGMFTNKVAAKATYVTNVEGLTATVSSGTTGTVSLTTSKAYTFQKGNYVGIQLPQETLLTGITVPTTLMNKFGVLYSANGKQWNRWKEGIPETPVRYLLLLNEGESFSQRILPTLPLKVSTPVADKVSSTSIPDGTIYQSHDKSLMTDGDYWTWTCLNRNQQTGDAYTLDYGKTIKVYDVRICMGTTNNDYMTAGRVQISTDGTNWKNLVIAGTTSVINYTLANSHNVKYSNEMTYCDFDGKGQEARYVRLLVSTANTSKWLRLYEIEVNKAHFAKQYIAPCTDSQGTNITACTDGQATTANDATVSGPLTFHLTDMADVQSITFYSRSATQHPTQLSVTTDGETWTPLCNLSADYQQVDLTTHPKAIAIKAEWTGEAPSIYEVEIQVNQDQKPVVTGLDSVTAPKSVKMTPLHDLSGRPILRPANGKPYIKDHKVMVP